MKKASVFTIFVFLALLAGSLNPVQAVSAPPEMGPVGAAAVSLPLEAEPPEPEKAHDVPEAAEEVFPAVEEAAPAAPVKSPAADLPVGTASISGTVKDGSGNVITGRGMYITVGNDAGSKDAAVSGTDGTYTVASLPAGTYTVSLRGAGIYPQYYNGVYTGQSATPVVLTDGEARSGINFTVSGGKVAGHVYRQSDGQVLQAWVSLHSDKYNGIVGMTADENGYYQFLGIPAGSYTLSSSAMGYAYGYNNPSRFSDPSGHIPVDEILDFLFLVYDVGAIYIEGPTPVNQAAFAADVLCATIPYVTGGGIAARLGEEAVLQGAVHAPAYLRTLQASLKAVQFSINSQESNVGDSLSRQNSIENLSRGDDEVRQYLGMGKDQKAADFLYFDKDSKRWATGESKGGKLEHAIEQLKSTYNAMIGKTPGAKGNVDFFIATNQSQYQRLLDGKYVDGYLMKNGYLGWEDENSVNYFL